MAILTHPLLMRLAKQVDANLSPLRWIDLYAAQYVADQFRPTLSTGAERIQSAGAKPRKESAQSGQTLDLFETMDAESLFEPLSVVLTQNDLVVLALMCSFAVSQGHTCLSLGALPQEIFSSAKACGYQPAFQNREQLQAALYCLDQPNLLRVANLSDQHDDVYAPFRIPLDSTSTTSSAPLTLWQDKLYLAKYWLLHQRFEAWLQSRRQYIELIQPEQIAPLAAMLRVLFNQELMGSDPWGQTPLIPDWQAVAAAHALINPFSLITGGPGTGKTTTAASLLCLLIYKHQLDLNGVRPVGSEPIKIRLLAPTGKAAVRLADAIRFQLTDIESRLEQQGLMVGKLSAYLPSSGETVHRFLYELGGLRDGIATPKAFRSDDILLKRNRQESSASNSKAATSTASNNAHQGTDIIIVDESSMMDLALMVELVSLIPADAKLILLGDHYQLPAVDPGQVFTDCVMRFSRQQTSGETLSTLTQLTGFSLQSLVDSEPSDSLACELGFQPLCTLRKTYRFDGDLKQAADYIKQGDMRSFSHHFRQRSSAFKDSSAVVWYSSDTHRSPDYPTMVQGYEAYFSAVARKADLATLATRFDGYQLLCSTLEGPLGVEVLNRYIEHRFYNACHANGHAITIRNGGELYHGKAILVTRNHPHLGIFNGDIGFVIEDERDGNLAVHFPGSEQSVKVVPPARINQWQTAYAMTVHKSQGSEYQRVGVVLADYARELLTRSLLYTALTRSKKHCAIWASEEALKKTMGSDPAGPTP